MLAAFLLTLAAQASGAQGALGDRLQGHCNYNPAVQAHRTDTVLVTCDSVTIDRADGAGGIAFVQRSWDVAMIRFQGEWTGNRMAVHHLVLRNGTEGAAKGACEIFRRDGRISTVTCLAVMAGRAYAANFEISRIGS